LKQFNVARAPTRGASFDTAAFREAIVAKLTYSIGKDVSTARSHDWFMATALAVRDRVVDVWRRPAQSSAGKNKRISYLSVEFLLGRLLFDTLGNLGITENARRALEELDVDLDDLRAIEPDQALGNGGLGRLAACFMDSMASLGMPAVSDGWQHEMPEDWLAHGNPWEFERPEVTFSIGFGGAVEYVGGDAQTARAVWYPAETINAVAYDTPITGWRGRRVNTLRLWSARAPDPIHLYAFNQGDFVGAMAARARAEAISRVLYPSDATPAGQELRLRQEYFFTSASLQDLLQRHLLQHPDLSSLPEHSAIQLNDTHPAIAVAELMRLLVDEHEFSWSDAWQITSRTLNYTNHTLLPEALECWPVDLMNRLLPRHLQIIYLINSIHLHDLQQRGLGDASLIASVSLIEEARPRRIRMGHLAFLGSHKINGVSALHTDLLRTTVFRELDQVRPGRIVNKTNGISFRRWLHRANPELTALLVDSIGERVLDDPDALGSLEILANDNAFLEAFAETRRRNKAALAAAVYRDVGVRLDPSALYDVQIKRVHEYKRQLLNVLEAVALYWAIRQDPGANWIPRVKILAGKAAANYTRAKLIIKFAHDVAKVINSDPVVGDRLKLVFLPNYNVSYAEAIIPAADLSEQISTAGMEASGTGNMKLALNGAVTIGTLDGANVEIRDRVGAENIVIFGMTAAEVAKNMRAGFTGYAAVEQSPRLSEVLESVRSGFFSPDEQGRYEALVFSVLGQDQYMIAGDFESYWKAQRLVDSLWSDSSGWWRTSVINTARMAWFSSDRTIREYAREIWETPA
jgi:starch phosphorylase